MLIQSSSKKKTIKTFLTIYPRVNPSLDYGMDFPYNVYSVTPV